MKLNTQSVLTILALSAAACTPARKPVTPAPAPGKAAEAPPPMPIITSSKLPPVPLVEGALKVSVIYPKANSTVEPVDSNFILGSVGNGKARLWINGIPVPVYSNGAFLGWLPNPKGSSRYDILTTLENDTARATHPIRIRVADTTRVQPTDTARILPEPVWVMLGVPDSVRRFVSDTDQVIFGRPQPGGDYKWLLLPKTPVQVVEYRGDYARVKLDDNQDAWVERKFIAQAPATFNAQARQATTFSVISDGDGYNLSIPMRDPVPFLVEEKGNSVILTLYGTAVRNASVPLISDSYLRSASVRNSNGRGQIIFELKGPAYGYLPLWRNGSLTFRLRRPPTISKASPLSGLTIAVDAGHPPGGAIGPTALWEAEATLQVALRVERMLQERGARVVMTRTGPEAVELGARPIMARRANAHALVSIHFNALPDGMNPYRYNGTETYYFHPHSKRLADITHSELVKEMGLKDKKSMYKNLALARPTWFPAILAEGAYIIMPDQEAAIRTSEYQEAYARAVVRGLERYFGEL